MTDDAGAVVYAESYDPYGGVQQTWPGSSFEPKRKFSDKERDEESGLDYFGARYYLNTGYRWMSVDLLTNRRDDPVSAYRWNLYAFCSNNPLKYTDISGREAEPMTINIFLGIGTSEGDLDRAELMKWNRRGYTINIIRSGTWTIDDFNKSLAAGSSTWTFFLGHSAIAGTSHAGIIVGPGEKYGPEPQLATSNKYVGIIACESSLFTGDWIVGASFTYSVYCPDKQLDDAAASDATYILIQRLLEGNTPEAARDKATGRLEYRLREYYQGHRFVLWEN